MTVTSLYDSNRPSSCLIPKPAGAVFGIDQGDALSLEFVADAIAQPTEVAPLYQINWRSQQVAVGASLAIILLLRCGFNAKNRLLPITAIAVHAAHVLYRPPSQIEVE